MPESTGKRLRCFVFLVFPETQRLWARRLALTHKEFVSSQCEPRAPSRRLAAAAADKYP